MRGVGWGGVGFALSSTVVHRVHCVCALSSRPGGSWGDQGRVQLPEESRPNPAVTFLSLPCRPLCFFELLFLPSFLTFPTHQGLWE